MAHSTPPSSYPAASKADTRALRELLRERRARDDAGAFVCEGPRVVAAALEHGAELLECFVGVDASAEVQQVARACAEAGAKVKVLDSGASARLGDTVTPQPLFATARMRRLGLAALGDMHVGAADITLVAVELGDPGNAGTLVRGAAAAGVPVVVLGSGSVDAYNPKVVRASAGAIFGVPVVEGWSAMEALDALGASGRRRLGAVAGTGTPYDLVDFTAPSAIVLGSEAHGLPPELDAGIDGWVTIPMAAPADSLNVAMAASILCFEAARQTRGAGR